MALSKMEIQQMLREMNVKFDAAESYDALKQRLQTENHHLWLKSVSENRRRTNEAGNVRVRKRRKADAVEDGGPAPSPPESSPASGPKRAPNYRRSSETAYRPRAIEKPKPGKPWKPAAEGTEPFNRKKNVFESVLRRAGGCCERCGSEARAAARDGLSPFHIQPLEAGGEHCTKNVVALCADCRDLLQDDPSTKELKELKRKTRARLYDAPQVIRKKPSASRPREDRGRR